MRRIAHFGVLGLVALGLLSVVPVAPAGAAPTHDQQYTAGTAPFFGPFPDNRLGQSFTAGIAGTLVRVDVDIEAGPDLGPQPDLTLQIFSTLGGVPDGALGTPTTIPQASLPPNGSPAFLPVTLTTPVPSVVGNQCAIVLACSSACGGSPGYEWLLGPAGTFAGGNAATFSSGRWIPSRGDFNFKTYVAVPDLGVTPTTIPTTTIPTNQAVVSGLGSNGGTAQPVASSTVGGPVVPAATPASPVTATPTFTG